MDLAARVTQVTSGSAAHQVPNNSQQVPQPVQQSTPPPPVSSPVSTPVTEQQPVHESFRLLVRAVERAQQRGVYTLAEANLILTAVKNLESHFGLNNTAQA